MLRINQLIGFGGASSPLSKQLIDIITDEGLDTNLVLCLDAGDMNSYSGSGDTFADLSAGGHDFYLGSTGTTDGDEPTFNGDMDNPETAYFEGDGGDKFRIIGGNPTWVNNLHKNNADWSFLMEYYSGASGQQYFLGNASNTYDDNGLLWRKNSSENLSIRIFGSAGSDRLTETSTLSVPSNSWNLIGLSMNEAGGGSGSFHFLNGSFDTFNGAYTSPSSGAATDDLFLFSNGGPGSMGVGERLGGIVAFTESLTQSQMTTLFNRVKSRKGII